VIPACWAQPYGGWPACPSYLHVADASKQEALAHAGVGADCAGGRPRY